MSIKIRAPYWDEIVDLIGSVLRSEQNVNSSSWFSSGHVISRNIQCRLRISLIAPYLLIFIAFTNFTILKNNYIMSWSEPYILLYYIIIINYQKTNRHQLLYLHVLKLKYMRADILDFMSVLRGAQNCE